MQGVIHANWSRVLILQEVCVQSGDRFIGLGVDIPPRHGTLEIILGQTERFGVDANGEILHQHNVPWWRPPLIDEPDVDFEGTQDLTDACRALLVKRSTHVLEVGVREFLKHFHLIWIDDLHDILFIDRFIELRFGFTTGVIGPEVRLKEMLKLEVKFPAIHLPESLEMRWEVDFDANVGLGFRIENRVDQVFFRLDDFVTCSVVVIDRLISQIMQLRSYFIHILIV